ncbi:MAG: hypothetical protein ACE5GW_00230 [Planctomycetota bacterium]
MMGIPVKKTIFGGALLLFLGGALWYLFSSGEPEPPSLEPVTELVYERVAARIADEVLLPPEHPTLLLPRIPGDGEDALRRRIQRRLHRRGGVTVLLAAEREPDGWFADKVAPLVERWLPLFGDERREEDPDLLLAARVKEIRDDEDSLRLVVDWEEGDLTVKDALLARGSAAEEFEKSVFNVEYTRILIDGSSALLRFTVWALILVLPPFLFLGFLRRVLREDSNVVNALLLVGFALPGAIAAWILTAFGSGWTGAALTILAVAVSALYSYGFLTAVEESRQ